MEYYYLIPFRCSNVYDLQAMNILQSDYLILENFQRKLKWTKNNDFFVEFTTRLSNLLVINYVKSIVTLTIILS